MWLHRRSAIKFLFTEANLAVPAWFGDELTRFYKGLKKQDAQERQTAVRKMKEGKEPMPFRLYEWLGKHFIGRGNAFALCYMTMTWNLCCRTVNTQGVRLKHLGWQEDALTVFFAVTKTDQAGNCNVLSVNVHS